MDVSTALVAGGIGLANGLTLYILNGINKKVTTICRDNRKEHDELYNEKNNHATRITTIETTHRLKGCDTFHKRVTDEA
jgi:hypothetical protein